jgi:hypothetical protein
MLGILVIMILGFLSQTDNIMQYGGSSYVFVKECPEEHSMVTYLIHTLTT